MKKSNNIYLPDFKVMKKFLWIFLFCSLIFIHWCWNNWNNEIQEFTTNEEFSDIKETLKTIVQNHESCNDNSKMFVNIVLLWNSINDKWNTEYYLVTDWQWFYIDERWNLNNSCGFGNVPTTIELSQNENWYNLIRYETAKDWNEYESSIKEMFSKEAYNKWLKVEYDLSDYVSTTQQAEEYFGVKIIPESKNNFECGFCDKTWYELSNNNENYKTNDLIFNYTAENNWDNTIYFNSNWSFEDNTSRELSWKWTWTWGTDANTIIVEKENVPVYFRYIITNQTNNSLWTILEIIQKG